MSETESQFFTQANRPSFLMGQDSRGNWVVQDQRGLCGGLFIDRAEAMKFALFENGHRPHAIITVPGVLELNMSKSEPNEDVGVAALSRAA